MIKIGTVQINNGFSGAYYLPYSIGLLVTYFKHYSVVSDNFSFFPPIYRRVHVDEAVKSLRDCDLICFSTYVWNEKVSLEIARRLKQIDENKIIIFGGPQVPDAGGSYLSEHPFIDVLTHQEGEITFSRLLEGLVNRDLSECVGISGLSLRIKQDGAPDQLVVNPQRPRMKEFSEVPSPYLTGFFDELLESVGESHSWLACWETNRGCPFKCAYCDWGSATASRVSKVSIDRAIAELEWFAKNRIEFVFTCDANFGMLERDEEIVDRAIEIKKQFGYPKVLSVQNTKNSKERSYRIQKKLFDSGLTKTVTIALQTTSENSLKAIMRDNIKSSDFEYFQAKFREDGISTYSEIIIGLPGETLVSFVSGIASVIESGQHNKIQFNNLSILPNAEMGSPDYMARHKIQTVDAPIINLHGTYDDCGDGIVETQKLVISTADLPTSDWKKARVFSSAVEFFYYTKILAVPLNFLNVVGGITYVALINELLRSNLPTLSFLRGLMEGHVDGMLSGNGEYIHSDVLDIYWPPGEYCYIEIIRRDMFDLFYIEAQSCLQGLLSSVDEQRVLADAFAFNEFLMCRPHAAHPKYINLDYDIAVAWDKWRAGDPLIPERGSFTFRKETENDYAKDDIEKWAKEIVWYGHRTGAYIDDVGKSDLRLAAHY